MNLRRIDPYRVELTAPGMALPATVYISEGMKAEEGAMKQLADAGGLPGVRKLLATPDIHQGYGVPIGCVVGLKGYVVPAAVGYDINCGMRLLETPLPAKDVSPEKIARAIASRLPLGEGKKNLSLSQAEFERVIEGGVPALAKIEERLISNVAPDWRGDEFEADLTAIEDGGALEGNAGAVSARAIERGRVQLATLGGGNHFVEMQRIENVYDTPKANRLGLYEDRLIIMLHSGSRGFGHQVGGDYMREAARLHGAESPSPSLAFLEEEEPAGRGYIGAMRAAANFAFANRELMAMLVRFVLRELYGEMPIRTLYDVPHNIAQKETHGGESIWVHRKGATRAFPPARMKGTTYEDTGSPVLIPGSMGTASYVLLPGPNAEESLASVNHGAGRRMSRTEAGGGRRGRRTKRPAAISDEAFREAMRGIFLYAENRRAAKEEAPQAYKDIDEVIDVVRGAGLAEPVARLVPLAVLKG